MKYVSSRGSAPVLEFGDVLLTGLAADGGLYLPEEWPTIEDHLKGPVTEERTYASVATDVIEPYVEGTLTRAELEPMVVDAYAAFGHPDVCPVRPLGDRLWLMELFWGPTLAFKDVALQLVGRLFDHELTRRGERATIVVATSGDTGSAAIEACRGRSTLDIVVLHPAGRVSDVQRRQMTTVDEPNVHNVALDGTFDDCQDVVKALFSDDVFRREMRLSAMNSINWARVMAQVTYYVTGARLTAPDGGPVNFAVPTGNFGNVLAGWVARSSGVPVQQLVIGSNSNDILPRWLATGVLESHEVRHTITPSMDIQVSSNLERLLFELFDRDGVQVTDALLEFRQSGRVDLGQHRLGPAAEVFEGTSFDDDQIRVEIARTYAETGLLIDPHSAVGVAAARSRWRDRDVPMVCLATAHPAKFPDAVEQATGVRPPLPEALADLLDRPERITSLPNDLAAVKRFMRAVVAHS